MGAPCYNFKQLGWSKVQGSSEIRVKNNPREPGWSFKFQLYYYKRMTSSLSTSFKYHGSLCPILPIKNTQLWVLCVTMPIRIKNPIQHWCSMSMNIFSYKTRNPTQRWATLLLNPTTPIFMMWFPNWKFTPFIMIYISTVCTVTPQ